MLEMGMTHALARDSEIDIHQSLIVEDQLNEMILQGS